MLQGVQWMDVFEYFAEKAEITEDGYEIGALHQLSDIGG